jgi:hypothetical protein
MAGVIGKIRIGQNNMKSTIAVESALIILMLLFGCVFVETHDISLKRDPSTYTSNTSIQANCFGHTLIWSDFDPATGYGGNHINPNSPYCGGVIG